jgi:hypothetical protein
MSCKKCGGSGDMFVLERGILRAVVRFSEVKAHLEAGYKDTGKTIECSLCGGYGQQ